MKSRQRDDQGGWSEALVRVREGGLVGEWSGRVVRGTAQGQGGWADRRVVREGGQRHWSGSGRVDWSERVV